MSFLGGRTDLIVGRIGQTESDVLLDSVIEEYGFLGDVSHLTA